MEGFLAPEEATIAGNVAAPTSRPPESDDSIEGDIEGEAILSEDLELRKAVEILQSQL